MTFFGGFYGVLMGVMDVPPTVDGLAADDWADLKLVFWRFICNLNV